MDASLVVYSTYYNETVMHKKLLFQNLHEAETRHELGKYRKNSLSQTAACDGIRYTMSVDNQEIKPGTIHIY